MSQLSRSRRAELRKVLLVRYPWLGATDVGPQAVGAGTCARCQLWPVLLPTCGAVAWEALCRDCARQVGTDAWCHGHQDEAHAALAWAAALPDEWADVVLVWWLATGEVRGDPPPSAARLLASLPPGRG